MKNLNALITNLENNAKSDWANEEGMASMYIQDAKDATIILKFITNPFGESMVNFVKASEYLNTLDTSIREGICMAIADDEGNDFLQENFGWSIK